MRSKIYILDYIFKTNARYFVIELFIDTKQDHKSRWTVL